MSTTDYQVLVRNGSSDLFVASVLGMVERLARGEIVTIDVESNETVPAAANVWREEAGRFHDDPTFDEFVIEIQSEKRGLDSEESAS